MMRLNDTLRDALASAQSFLTTLLKDSVTFAEQNRRMIPASELAEPEDGESLSILFRDSERGDLLVQLEESWLPILSSRMMGVEETTVNEVSRDLIQRFASELGTTVAEALARKGVETNVDSPELVSASRFFKTPEWSRYLCLTLLLDGLQKNPLRIRLWIGGDDLPESVEEPEASDSTEDGEQNRAGNDGVERSEQTGGDESGNRTEKEKESSMSEEDQEFKTMDPDEMATPKGGRETVISGRHVQFEEFEDEDLTPEKGARGLELLKDIEMDLSVELGRIQLPLGKVLELTRGSVIELERLAGEPVDVLVNGHKIAYGEVVVIDEHFGVRISNLITTRQKLVELQ